MTAKTSTTTPGTCLCGCGTTTGGKFAPGHDARMVSQLVAELTNTIADGGKVTRQMVAASAKRLPSTALQAKFTRAAERATTPKPAKAETEEAAA